MKSNVRSAEYKAAGGRAWNRVKSRSTISQTFKEKQLTPSQVADRQHYFDKLDKYQSRQDAYRRGQQDCLSGKPRDIDGTDHYQAGYSYAEYTRNMS